MGTLDYNYMGTILPQTWSTIENGLNASNIPAALKPLVQLQPSWHKDPAGPSLVHREFHLQT